MPGIGPGGQNEFNFDPFFFSSGAHGDDWDDYESHRDLTVEERRLVKAVHHQLSALKLHGLAHEWEMIFSPSSHRFFANRLWSDADSTIIMAAIRKADPNRASADKTNLVWQMRDCDGLTLLHQAIKSDSTPGKIIEMIELGADITTKSSFKTQEITTRHNHPQIMANALEYALCSGKFKTLDVILRLTDRRQVIHSNGEAQIIAAEVGDQLNGLITSNKWADLNHALKMVAEVASIIDREILLKAINWEPVEQGISLLVLSLLHGASAETVNLMIDQGARTQAPRKREREPRYEIFDENRKVKYVDEATIVRRISSITGSYNFQLKKNSPVIEEAKKLYKEHKNLQHLYWYVDLFADACIKSPPGDCASAAKLVGYIQNIYPPKQLDRLFNAVEGYNDSAFNKDREGFCHPFFREMVAMLYHPAAPNWRNSDVASITRAITSQKQWIQEDLRLGRQVVFNWIRLGKFTHDFRSLKWDTVRPKEYREDRVIRVHKSLLEQFGAVAIESRFTDSKILEDGSVIPRLGPGFLLSGAKCAHKCILPNHVNTTSVVTVSESTLFEFRRSYYRITHPDYGVIIISNSSPEFGRSCLKDPFYYLPAIQLASWSERKQLATTEDEIFDRCYAIDDISINKSPENARSISYLLNQLAAVRDKYRLWKFNNDLTQAWDEEHPLKEYRLLGGHRSPGFKKLVEMISRFSENSEAFKYGRAAVDLAFFDTRMAPWLPQQFYVDGQPKSRISVTPAVLGALKRITKAESPEREFEEDFKIANLRNFFEFGLKNGSYSELIILDSTNSRSL